MGGAWNYTREWISTGPGKPMWLVWPHLLSSLLRCVTMPLPQGWFLVTGLTATPSRYYQKKGQPMAVFFEALPAPATMGCAIQSLKCLRVELNGMEAPQAKELFWCQAATAFATVVGMGCQESGACTQSYLIYIRQYVVSNGRNALWPAVSHCPACNIDIHVINLQYNVLFVRMRRQDP